MHQVKRSILWIEILLSRYSVFFVSRTKGGFNSRAKVTASVLISKVIDNQCFRRSNSSKGLHDDPAPSFLEDIEHSSEKWNLDSRDESRFCVRVLRSITQPRETNIRDISLVLNWSFNGTFACLCLYSMEDCEKVTVRSVSGK